MLERDGGNNSGLTLLKHLRGAEGGGAGDIGGDLSQGQRSLAKVFLSFFTMTPSPAFQLMTSN